MSLLPPIAPKRPKVTTLHGLSQTDDYAWLRDDAWQEVLKNPKKLSGEIRAYLEAENQYTAEVTAPLKELEEKLFLEMKARIQEDDATPPMQDGDYWYYTRTTEGQQYPIYCRHKGKNGPEEVYFDVNKAAAGQEFYKLGALEVSPDHTKVALLEDTNGSEVFTLRVLDIATQAPQTAPISGLYGDIVWANDSATLFYVTMDENHNPNGVRRHKLGNPMMEDALVHEEKNSGHFVNLERSIDSQYIFITVGAHTSNAYYFLDANTPEAPFKCFTPQQEDVRYSLEHGGGVFYILTNKDGATDFKICTCTLEDTSAKAWQDLVPHRKGYLPKRMALVEGMLIWLEIHEATPCILLQDLVTGAQRPIIFEEAAYDLSLHGSLMFTTDTIRFSYSSPTTPSQVFDYNIKTHERTLVKEQIIPSGHTPQDYVVEHLMAKSHDGVNVPVTILRHKNTPQDGTAPLWLYGYGAYGFRVPAVFNHLRLSLVNRGFIFAIAHVRGGTECGYSWYLEARQEKKVNSFHDFIAVAETLITQKYTSAGNIFAEGRSAGGMLMGAVTNMRPDLWRLVHLGVPFVDVLNTMCDATLPLTPPEWPEWGNPIEDKKAYKTIAAFCPYVNLKPQDYPHTLITSSLTDYRVTYWEPAKYTAKMRACNTAQTRTLLKMEMNTGHGGASGRFDRLREDAFVFAVVLDCFGLSGRKKL